MTSNSKVSTEPGNDSCAFIRFTLEGWIGGNVHTLFPSGVQIKLIVQFISFCNRLDTNVSDPTWSAQRQKLGSLLKRKMINVACRVSLKRSLNFLLTLSGVSLTQLLGQNINSSPWAWHTHLMVDLRNLRFRKTSSSNYKWFKLPAFLTNTSKIFYPKSERLHYQGILNY